MNGAGFTRIGASLTFALGLACSSTPRPPGTLSLDASSAGDAGNGAQDAVGSEGACTDAPRCLARFPLPGSTYELPYYRTFPIDRADPSIKHVVLFNQGLDRDAANDFALLVTAAQRAGQLASTLVITPHFEAVVDVAGQPCAGNPDQPGPSDLVWTCDAWSDGLAATNDGEATSYGALDALLSVVEETFPGLEALTVAGFSAGGQLTQRYAAVNAVDRGKSGLAFRYVVGSPSSYVYFDDQRPIDADSCTQLACSVTFAPYAGAAQCPDYDDWKYGTEKLEGAAAARSPGELETAYLGRSVRYLFGSLDDGPTALADVSQLDVTCPATAQGPYRLQRGLAFHAYVTHVLHAREQRATIVPGCGHSGSCVFQSDAGLSAVFGDGP